MLYERRTSSLKVIIRGTKGFLLLSRGFRRTEDFGSDRDETNNVSTHCEWDTYCTVYISIFGSRETDDKSEEFIL